jgi:vitamin B12 transporter
MLLSTQFKRFTRFLTILVLVISVPLFPTTAEPTAEKEKQEAEPPMFTEVVEVVGNVPVAKTIQSVSVFKIDELERFNFESMKSVLNLTPGLLTLSNGGFGQSSSTYIRGSKPSQVLYIVDGIKLRDGANINGVDLSVVSPNIIDKVEVVRGPLSSLYGSDAMGGVISMNTSTREGARFSASYGSHGSYMGNFSGLTKLKDLDLGLAVNSQRYSDDVLNDVFKNTGLSARLNYNKNAVDAGLRFFGSFTDSGIPFNDYGISTPMRKYKQEYLIFALPVTYSFNEQSKMDVRLSYTNSKYTFEDEEDVWSPYFMSKFQNYEAEIIYSTRLFERLNLDTGIDYSDQVIKSENSFGSILDDEKMNYFSAFINTGLNLNALQLSASVRYDKYKSVAANVSPQVGISYLFSNRFKLRAAYSHSFLAPVISQQVNPWGEPNFSLAPEKGKSIEVGAEYYSQKAVLSATYFNTRYEDMIEWVTVDWVTFAGQFRNIKNVDTYGVELSATLRPFEPLTVVGAYSYLHTEDRETGEPLVRKPRHTFSGFISYAHKRFTLSLNMIYVGKRPDLDFNNWPPEVESAAFNTFNLSLVVPVLEGLSIFGKITNAFDKEYQEFFGYYAPGRRFEVGLKYKMK